ncbi:hypothetical protein [Isobaculum melis]|uniref:Uncharacterized protein n=1 Tax=Isobaculum melis TaxID=142588 RepID=A0A1H9TTL3_9LACT|nr:hypothetical protein [Isobaculum melis]SES00670.1 hypothetical protein SAMN04488559_11644 [Isobaculum melis]
MNLEKFRNEMEQNDYFMSEDSHQALQNLKFETLKPEDYDFLKELYKSTDGLYIRNQILKAFVLQEEAYPLKDFFEMSFKKERYLDMRFLALRGYCRYASEEEVEPFVIKFQEILLKREQSTPYHYQEYEPLRSIFGFPYLIKTYQYNCLIDLFNQLEQQYQHLPDAFKGIYTFDENGTQVLLRSPKESKQRMDAFWRKKGMR